MKNLFTIAVILLTAYAHAQSGNNPNRRQLITTPDDDIRTQFGFIVDPTLTDRGFQFGVNATMIMHFGFIGAEITTYPELEDGYVDVVGQLGLNWHMLEYEPVRYYAGFRGGAIFRDGLYGLAGGLVGFDVRIVNQYNGFQMHIGLRLWTDYRTDQENRAYGDSDSYEKGLIIDNPLMQENGAILISFSF